jgi:hypothetical protein
MRLNDMVGAALGGAAAKITVVTARLKRDAILYAVCAFCGVVAVIYAASASVLALEPEVGAVYARLILAGAFAFVVAAIMIGMRLARPSAAPAAARMPRHAEAHAEAQAEAAQRSAQFAQLAMVIEAAMLGYSMARRR